MNANSKWECDDGVTTQQDAHVDVLEISATREFKQRVFWGGPEEPRVEKKKCGDQSFSPCKEPDSSPISLPK